MKIKTDKQHRDVHTATVYQDVAHRIIAERVAEKLGVNLNNPSLTWRAYYDSRDTSTGVRRDVKVEIICDHRPGAEIKK